MSENNTPKKEFNYIISDNTIERREDIYSIKEFGRIVNRISSSEDYYSEQVWEYIKSNYNIKKENITMYCDIHYDVKNRMGKSYKYIINIEKPNKMIFIFFDEEKIQDNNYYDFEEEKRNRISDFTVYFESDSYEQADKLINELEQFIYLPPKNKTFYVISSSSLGYELSPANIKDYDIQLGLNYGEDFVPKYDDILDKLKNQKKGLFLFHGESGTGKTTLIRKLISDLAEDKTVIYIPSYFIWDIANPELISFISKFKKSILLLEDAETILTSTQEERNQAVSNILNISDGLLNDHMDIQIIATFNISRDVIDDALLRKGRLMVEYKFKKLTAEQSTRLSAHIGLNKKYTESKTLAEIYEETNGGKQLIETGKVKKKLGF